MFDQNFNKKTFETVKQEIQAIIDKSHTFQDLYFALGKYDRTVDYFDDYTVIKCEVELDRSRMETDANYVSVIFLINWSDETLNSFIDFAVLYYAKDQDDYSDALCAFNPETCKIIKWLYDPDIPPRKGWR